MYAKKLDSSDLPKVSPFSFLSPLPLPDHTWRFTFYKSKEVAPTCSSKTCPRRGTFSPLEWSRYR